MEAVNGPHIAGGPWRLSSDRTLSLPCCPAAVRVRTSTRASAAGRGSSRPCSPPSPCRRTRRGPGRPAPHRPCSRPSPPSPCRRTRRGPGRPVPHRHCSRPSPAVRLRRVQLESYGSGLGVVLGTLNEHLSPLASDASFAASWVQSYVQPFAGSVRFRYINAGNEVIPGESAALVLPAMKNLEAALRNAGISVPVTTAVATSVLGSSYPPSQGAFSEAALPTVEPIVSFLASRSTPLLVNVYPYFAYSDDPTSVPLDYALLSSSAAVAVTDNGVEYANMFDAILDAVYAAVEKAGGGESLELVVSETGWPSGGGGYGASVENAAAYVNNLVRHVGRGTPRRPGKAVETYIFAMFNENQKPEGVEQHFGLFQPDMSEVYHVDFWASSS